MWQSFVCAMMAAVTLQAFNPFRTGKLVLYQVTYSTGWHGFELVPFVVLGIVGVSISTIRYNRQCLLLVGSIRRALYQAQHEDIGVEKVAATVPRSRQRGHGRRLHNCCR